MCTDDRFDARARMCQDSAFRPKIESVSARSFRYIFISRQAIERSLIIIINLASNTKDANDQPFTRLKHNQRKLMISLPTFVEERLRSIFDGVDKNSRFDKGITKLWRKTRSPGASRKRTEFLMVTRWQSIFEERMRVSFGAVLSFFFFYFPPRFFLAHYYNRVFHKDTISKRVQQNSFSSPPGRRAIVVSPPVVPLRRHSSPVHLVSLHSGAAIITLSFN